MLRHDVSGLAATRFETFPMLRQTFWRVRPGGHFSFHKQTCVECDATRRRNEAPKVQPLAASSAVLRLADCHAIARIAFVAADHVGHVQRSVFIKVGIERAIYITRIDLQIVLDCSLLSLDLENAFDTISRRSFLAELYKSPDLHLMTYSRDSTLYYFDPNDASLLYGMVRYCMGVRQGDPPGPLLLTWRSSPPPEY
jgi:hypothetical protein